MAARARAARKAAPSTPGPAWRLPALFLGLYLALGLVHAYATVARYDPAKQQSGDPGVYLDMARGKPLDQVPRVYRWRVFTPLAVALLPGLPEALTRHYQADPLKLLRFKFAAWNVLGNALAALGLMLFLLELGFAAVPAGVGGLLFCLSFQVVVDGAAALVDPWSNAALILCLWLALRGRTLALALVFAVGLFTKETAALVAPYLVLLAPPKWKAQLLALLPAVLAYAWFRYVLYPGGQGVEFNWAWISGSTAEYLRPSGLWLYFAAEAALNFAVLGPLAALGWRDAAVLPALRRMAWLLPALALAPVVLGTELARIWFDGFPVFLPLAVLGLWRLGGWAGAPEMKTAR